MSGCELYFNDRGWEVVTSAWTAGSKGGKNTDICYTWGADGISFFDSATGTARLTLDLPFRAFIAYVAACKKNSTIADLSSANLPYVRAQFNDPRPQNQFNKAL